MTLKLTAMFSQFDRTCGRMWLVSLRNLESFKPVRLKLWVKEVKKLSAVLYATAVFENVTILNLLRVQPTLGIL